MSLLHTAVGVFTIANPIGNLPIYLSFTNGNPRQDRAIARGAAFTFIIALLISTWIGNGLLEFFGISRGAFQIAGGVIVVLIGLSMLRSQTPPEHHDPESVARDQSSSVKGVVPLGIPLLAGPGTLTVVIADPLAASVSGRLGISVVVFFAGCCGLSNLCCRGSDSKSNQFLCIAGAHKGDGASPNRDCRSDAD